MEPDVLLDQALEQIDESREAIITALAYLGGLVVLRSSYKCASWLWRTLLRPGKDLRRRYMVKERETWAVVTGASDGLGKAFALELAARGFNIVLIGRTPSKLRAAQDEVSELYVKTKAIACDLSAADDTFYLDLRDQLAGLDVAVLVNNAGIAVDPAVPLWQDANCETLLGCNVKGFTKILVTILPMLLKRGNGGIINVSSATTFFMLPFQASYCASKAYNDRLSQVLRVEVSDHKIDVLSFVPFFCATSIVPFGRSWLVASPGQAVRGALRCLGHDARTFGWFSHSLQGAVLSLLPEWVWEKGILMNMRSHSARQHKSV